MFHISQEDILDFFFFLKHNSLRGSLGRKDKILGRKGEEHGVRVFLRCLSCYAVLRCKHFLWLFRFLDSATHTASVRVPGVG